MPTTFTVCFLLLHRDFFRNDSFFDNFFGKVMVKFTTFSSAQALLHETVKLKLLGVVCIKIINYY